MRFGRQRTVVFCKFCSSWDWFLQIGNLATFTTQSLFLIPLFILFFAFKHTWHAKIWRQLRGFGCAASTSDQPHQMLFCDLQLGALCQLGARTGETRIDCRCRKHLYFIIFTRQTQMSHSNSERLYWSHKMLFVLSWPKLHSVHHNNLIVINWFK